jgi:hypothetical protein
MELGLTKETGLMRILKIVAIAALACGAFATQASATSLVTLDYVGGSSVCPSCTGGAGVDAAVGDTLTFSTSVQADSGLVAGGGMLLISYGISAAGLDYVSNAFPSGPFPTSSGAFVNPLIPLTRGTSELNNIGWTNLAGSVGQGGPETVILGNILFVVTGTGGIQSGFFDMNSAVAQATDFSLITPDFASAFAVAVPEPGLSVLMALGLLGLGISGRKSKK